MNEHYQFLEHVRLYVQAHPEAAAYVSDYVAKGLTASRQEALERAADMEVALVAAITKRLKNSDSLILSKLEKWNGKSAINWTSTIEKLKNA